MKNGEGCKYFKKCGACQLRNLSYDEQLSYKMSRVIKTAGRFCHVEEIIPMENPSAYRNKAQAVFYEQNGKVFSGIYQSSSGKIIRCDSCPVETPVTGRIIRGICDIMNELKLHAYDPEKDRGFLRHTLIRQGFATGEIMVVLVSRTPAFPKESLFISLLTERFPQITTVIHNVNDTSTPLWLTDNERVVYGSGQINDILCGCEFGISARSFYQINPIQTQKLYEKAMSLAELTGNETVLDAYSGIGTIGIIAAKRCGFVHCVESNKSAVYDAIRNAAKSGVKNIKFFNSDTTKFIHKALVRRDRYDVVFIDPPRAGCDKNFLSTLITLAPKKIVYISCNPDTLAGDMAYLRGGGYKATYIQPVDLFPHTNHVETVCLLTRNK